MRYRAPCGCTFTDSPPVEIPIECCDEENRLLLAVVDAMAAGRPMDEINELDERYGAHTRQARAAAMGETDAA